MERLFKAIGISLEGAEGIKQEDVARLLSKTLAPRECDVIVKYYGIGCEPTNMDEIAKATGARGGKNRISQIHLRVLAKLNHPVRRKQFEDLVEDERWSHKDKDIQALRKQLKDLSREFLNLSILAAKILEVPVNDYVATELFAKSIDYLDMSTRTTDGLKKQQVMTIGDLIQRSEPELLSGVGLGTGALTEIKEALKRKGLTLRRN